VAYGKIEFKKQWGNRPLADNWRWSAELRNVSAAQDGTPGNEIADGVASADAKTDARYTTDYYLEQLPTEQTVIDSLAKDRNFAYYQLGIIYKEKFKEYRRAADKLEKL